MLKIYLIYSVYDIMCLNIIQPILIEKKYKKYKKYGFYITLEKFDIRHANDIPHMVGYYSNILDLYVSSFISNKVTDFYYIY